jgi:xanthine dehydrogenase accessory factor
VNWLEAAASLRTTREAGVLVTVLAVRGHAPREAGAKMVVSATRTWGSVGGGDLEATAVERARLLIESGASSPEQLEHHLSDRARHTHGVQCCGGEVTLVLEPLPVVPAVAIFGLGHVGLELARILARHDLDLHLVDTRAGALSPEALAPLDDALAHVVLHPAVVPEVVLGELPRGAHVLVMTHDHAEDAALVDMALRCVHLGSIGLIGSSAKWRRLRVTLRDEGHDDAALDRVITPIGLPDLSGKDPATIAVGVAVEVLRAIGRESAEVPSPGRGGAAYATTASPGRVDEGS